MRRSGLVAIVTYGLMLLWPSSAIAALHDDFRYKWPWSWQTSAAITTSHSVRNTAATRMAAWPYECVAAYDFVIAGGGVMSANEAQVSEVHTGVTQCGSNLGYGNYVVAGGVLCARLAALAPGVSNGANLLQGDGIGTQGTSGNVLPCDYPSDQRGAHLHWEFLGASQVPTIDGGSGTSGNSTIGEYSTAGLTLRTYYTNKGGWNTIGWTTKHCPGTCTLNMTNNLAWGRMKA